MVTENVPYMLHSETGATSEALGRYTEYPASMRFLTALIWLGIGFGGAALLIVVPVVHLISTWLLPLVAVLGAFSALRTPSRVSHVTGRCPVCQGKLLLAGGRAEFPVRDSCEHCGRPLTIHQK